jgi:flagellin-like hook-associated protein FlgL
MSTSFTAQLSKVVDVDVISATTDLQQDQTTYQAALWAASKVIQPTLVSFLS